MLHWASWVALALIAGAVALAWSRKFLALGSLAIANIAIYALTELGPRKLCMVADSTGTFSAIRCDLSLHGHNLGTDPFAFVQLISSMFVHADLFHLLGNMLILLAFSLPFEERIGGRKFLAVYLATGVLAALAQVVVGWGSPMLLMGASGAVFGIIGAFAGAYPNLVVPLPLPLFIIMIWVRMRVIVAAAVFAVVQIVLQALSSFNPGDRTAYAAHLGGLLAGLILARMVVPKQPQPVKLDQALHRLELFAHGRGARNALAQMRAHADEPDVFQAWEQRLFDELACPVCEDGASMMGPGKILCGKGHAFDLKKDTYTDLRTEQTQPLGSLQA